jgi:hypothetical protein
MARLLPMKGVNSTGVGLGENIGVGRYGPAARAIQRTLLACLRLPTETILERRGRERQPNMVATDKVLREHS